MILSPHEIAWLGLYVADWTPDVTITMTAISLAETGGDTDVLGRSPASSRYHGQRDHGLYQISGKWWGALLQQHRWRDPRDNALMARIVWDAHERIDGNGAMAWAVFNSGAYEEFMPDAAYGIAHPFEPPRWPNWRH